MPKAPEPVKSRRKRLMVDEAARQAGQVILETGTRLEIFAEDSGEEEGGELVDLNRAPAPAVATTE